MRFTEILICTAILAVSCQPSGDEANLALHRCATSSSAYDYNLTAQLLTDGIIPDCPPAYIALCTDEGPVERIDREKMFDYKSSTVLTVPGPDNHIYLTFHGYRPVFGKTVIAGKLTEASGAHWTISLEALRPDGIWTMLSQADGSGTDILISMDAAGVYDSYRLTLHAERGAEWKISDWDFMDAGTEVEMYPDDKMIYKDIYSRENLTCILPGRHFNSTWQSRGFGEEWVCVDLGGLCRLASAELFWNGLPASGGHIEISRDGSSWKKVAELNLEGPTSIKGRGRYVKVTFEGSSDGEPYRLGELAVYGKRTSLKNVKPEKPSTEQCVGSILSLNGDSWLIRRESELGGASGEAISTTGFDCGGWVPGVVPATVLSSYIRNGSVPDPREGDNQLQISDSYFAGAFWYRTVFDAPLSEGGRRILRFDGVNHSAEIFLNGRFLGTLEGAFRRGAFDVTEGLARKGNVLAVKVIPPAHQGAVKEATLHSVGGNGGVLGGDNPTFHASIGWDWIPTVRGRDAGIWNDVMISCEGDVSIEDPAAFAELNLPDTTEADVTMCAVLRNLSEKQVSGVLTGCFGDAGCRLPVSLGPLEEKEVRLPAIHLTHPRLWWPNGYGEPFLYDVKLAFETAGGSLQDSVSFQSGVRQMSWNEDGGILTLFVNGHRFMGKGGNWGMSEGMLGYRAADYDAALRYHADMHFNMIRNWVCQTGDDEFYDACDRYGIMVWQDFWLANPSDGPVPYRNDMFMDNARDFVSRIRRHPSLALYCGRNEGNPPAELDAALRKTVSGLHPGMHFIASSADGVVSGRGPYRALPAGDYFSLYGEDRFHSERGMPCVVNYESLERMMPAGVPWPQDNLWGMHDLCLNNAQSARTYNALIEAAFGPSSGAEEYCLRGQWANYEGFRAIFESRSRSRRGMLLWMSHPAWPSLAFQTYDYYLDPNGAYFGCKKACEPLHIQFNPLEKAIEALNTGLGDAYGLTARCGLYDLGGGLLWEKTAGIDLPEDSTVRCFDVSIPSDISEVYFLKMSLEDGGNTISENFYILGREEGNLRALCSLPEVSVAASADFHHGGSGWDGVTLTLSNKSETTPAVMLRVALKDGDGRLVTPIIYSDNYFTLLPGESRTVTATFAPVSEKPAVDIRSCCR